ncbi:hypothetical protein LCGC14_0113140 [marine sediment metagenome]|uniref:Uncharacterized protein n=1 Tax=marine sediment metagenome TaxID=412755 RepID=A0A0F9YBV5_9ZZZZ
MAAPSPHDQLRSLDSQSAWAIPQVLQHARAAAERVVSRYAVSIAKINIILQSSKT